MILGILATLACLGQEPCAIPSGAADSIWTRNDIVYRVAGADTLRLDFARARRETPQPLVVMVHGGGWRAGSRSERLPPMVRRMASAGYAVAAVSYRLTTGESTRYPAAIEDVWCSIAWLDAHAAELGIDSRRIVVLGESAGGQIAAMTAYAPSVASRACGDAGLPARIRGFVGLYGIYDFLALEGQPRARSAVEHNLGRTPESDTLLARTASPVSHAGLRDLPALLLHGSSDRSVALAQSRAMAEAVRRGGAAAQVVEVALADHGFPMLSDSAAFRESSCALLAFLARTLRPAQGANHRILARDFEFTLPRRVPAGLVRMRLINNGSEPHYLSLMRVEAGRGAADFLEWRRSRTPRPAWLTPAGGHGTIAPGDSLGLALYLRPGRYIVFCGYPSPDGVSHTDKGMIGEIEVEDAGAADVAAPTAAATVTLTDSSISVPAVRTGRQTLRVVNASTRLHQVLLVRLPDGVSAEQDLGWFRGGFRGERAGIPFGGVIQLPPGDSAWMSMTYAPGRYLLICAIADGPGRHHFDRGMRAEFTVAP